MEIKSTSFSAHAKGRRVLIEPGMAYPEACGECLGAERRKAHVTKRKDLVVAVCQVMARGRNAQLYGEGWR
jgi:hypothetical protein